MTLAKLVDDFLAKHEIAVAAGRVWDGSRGASEAEREAALSTFIAAHNARAAAFKALRAARQLKSRKP